jgi:hypothetical protein
MTRLELKQEILMARIRIVGIAFPWFGVSWGYGDSDKDIVRRVFTFLEDRRVLYTSLDAQTFYYVGASVGQIRDMLTGELSAKSIGIELRERLQSIRRSLRKFMDALDQIQRLENSGSLTEFEVRDRQVLALGEMRGSVSPILADLAIKYEVEVEEDLAAVLQSAASVRGAEDS